MMRTLNYGSCQQKCIDLLTTYSEIIKASNKQGLGNNSKTSEEVYRGLLNILYPNSNYESPGKINEPAIDLYDHSQRIVVQIKASLTRSEIKECVEKFSKTTWYNVKNYDLIILLTTSNCLPKEEEFHAGSYTYTNFDHCYLDNNRLLKRINGSNCNQVFEYLKFMTTDSPQSENSQVAQTVNNYGTTLNFSGSGDVSFDGTTFHSAPDNRQLKIDEASHRDAPQNLLDIKQNPAILYEKDTPDNQLRRISSAILKIDDLYLLIEPEVKKLYKHLEELESTQHSEVAKVLWLIIFYENSEKHMPTRGLRQRMLEVKDTVSLHLSFEYKKLLSELTYYSDNSKNLISSIRYCHE